MRVGRNRRPVFQFRRPVGDIRSVIGTCFEQQNLDSWILGKSGRENTAGGTGTDDNDIEFRFFSHDVLHSFI